MNAICQPLVLKWILYSCRELVYFDTRGQNDVSRTVSVKMQHDVTAESNRPRSPNMSATFPQEQ